MRPRGAKSPQFRRIHAMEEYPHIPDDIDTQNLRQELQDWYAFFWNNHGDGSFGREEYDSVEDRNAAQESFATEMTKRILPQIVENHRGESQ